MVHVAVAQFAPGNDKEANVARVASLVGEAADRGARVVVLPEYSLFTVAAMSREFLTSAEDLDGRFVTELRGLAKDRQITVVAGINEALPGGERISNTLVAAGPDGAIAALYRKLHLYDAFGFRESELVRPGDIEAPETFEVDGIVFGLQTCYDLRFPEVTRRLVDAGADAVLLPAEWMPGPLKEDHWTTLIRARAIENTIYLVAAGQAAPTGSGHSMIVDPMGVVVASLGERTGTATGEVSAERISEVRAKNPALELRRFAVTPRS
ncbi:carbon-nitrogen hydrolase family protein [Amycolatopsis umgeniensis]|uniref:Putative amidohydrolase n=1 Tax=Amycolatopsis umgeniensis TaxID=336628 RepID=A0A841ATX3_9PSEU|nr:carbon-nitrogen hydrolase family protein [Amycolatopsis umgeniensis]MBB5850393.1 putative amidohydrolase [Amycolatopsis umgeniensis]